MDTSQEKALHISDVYEQTYLQLLGIVILYYDYCLTFSMEVTYIWSRRNVLSSWPFLLNRYFSILANIATIVGTFAPFKTVKRRCVPDGYNGGQKSDNSIDFFGCHTVNSKISAIHVAVTWECLFVFDTMILCLTLYKSHKELSQDYVGALHLFYLIARDGAVYFAVMTCATLVNVFTFYFWTPALRGALSVVASSVSVSMISRLMLNLYERAHHGMRTTIGSGNNPSTTLLRDFHVNLSALAPSEESTNYGGNEEA
ncbi:hypothetical protein EIP91_007775 [Steccherinum ochraceum]|uniref:DUF6533 domain-containing protein n=1 Tax=Steccherinum ochraceum TaxID=92696 RepID=A0A4R0RYN2_9APHY|nr:hypothetical protein EIP91_007775 [Steccherinum ochraceum]